MPTVFHYLLPAIPADESGQSTRLVRIGLAAILVFLGGFALWGSLAPISGAVIAEGMVKIDTNRKTVQHLDGGIIKEIRVREGSVVQQGQPLIVLEDTNTSANVNILSDQFNALLAREARLLAEKKLATAIVFPDELRRQPSSGIAELLANEQAVFASRRKSLDDQIALTHAQIDQAKVAVEALSSQITAIEDSIHLSEKQVNAGESLRQKHFIEEFQFWKLKQTLAGYQSQRGEQQAELAQNRRLIAELELRIIRLRNDYVEQADSELKETRRSIFEIQERLRPARRMLEREVITAPLTGQVINLRITTVGGVIKPGEPLLDIVPQTDELVIEIRIRPQDIDNVYIGQSAEIQLLAYNSRTTPLLAGKVVYVSGDALSDPSPLHPQQYYLAHVQADADSLDEIRRLNVNLYPGMPVVNFIRTKPKTFFEYLMAPVVDSLRRTFRES